MALSTALDGIHRARAYLMGSTREELNTLSGAHNASTTTFTFTNDLKGIQAGVRLSVNLEEVHVVSVTSGSKTATVIRGVNGSTAASHATGDIVIVKPRFSNFDIFEGMNATLQEVSGDEIFRVGSVDLTATSVTQGYNLTSVTDLIEVLQVRWKPSSATNKYWSLAKRDQDWVVQQSASTTDFASGNAIFFYNSMPSGSTIRVTYKRPLAAFTATSDVMTTVSGLPSMGAELPVLGACVKLTTGRELQRNFYESQGDTRRADEVPSQGNTGAYRLLERRFDTLLDRVATDLSRKYPAV